MRRASAMATRRNRSGSKALVTLGTGELMPVLRCVLPTFEAYAQRHGYRLVVGDVLDAGGRPPAWGKVALMRRLLNEVDEVLWVDADAVILDDSEDLADSVAPGSYQALVRHVTDNGEVPNTGVWFVRGDRGRQFLDAVWRCEKYINHNWWENAALLDLLGYSLDLPIQHRQRTNWSAGTQWLSPKWNAVPPWIPRAVACHIRHYAGARWAGWSAEDLVWQLSADLSDQNDADSKNPDYRTWEQDHLKSRLETIFRRLVAESHAVIAHGPFAGMVYLSDVQPEDLLRGSALVPKLVGSYEAELHGAVAHILRKRPATIVNVGCGEGYYAVGLARLLDNAYIHAFDTDVRCQQWCAEMAQLNDVSHRIAIAGACDLDHLRALTTTPVTLFVDCEGEELQLLRPDELPGLAACEVLVELHDFINPSISETLYKRFAPTHRIQIIESAPRDPRQYPVVTLLNTLDRRLAVDEFRPAGMQWALMSPRT